MEQILSGTKQVTAAPRVPADFAELLKWANVIRRMISVSRSGGYGIITIRVIVDANGTPIHYATPVLTKLEPKAESADVLAVLLENLTA